MTDRESHQFDPDLAAATENTVASSSRTSFTLNSKTASDLDELGRVLEISTTDIINRAIATQAFLVRERENGAQIYILDRHGKSQKALPPIW